MIIDSHVYCFEPVDHPAGHTTGKEHLKWVQASHARHHQPAFRLTDKAPASSEILAPNDNRDLSNLPDLDFRTDRTVGRVMWTVEGKDYTKHFFPPNLRNVEFTADSIIGEMDYAGVNIALIHTDPMLGKNSKFLMECVRKYPNRLRSMAPVSEWNIVNDPDGVIDNIHKSINEYGLHAIKFMPPHAYMNDSQAWDDGDYRPFWEAVNMLKVPIFFTLGTGPMENSGQVSLEKQRVGYLNEQRILMRWMERYPNIVCSLTHGFPWRLFLENNNIVVPPEIWEPFQNPNCNLEVCFPVRLGDLFDFPYSEIWPTLQEMLQNIGADHLLWGTDMPFQNRFCTYRQSRDWIERYCTFLNQQDLNAIMGGTAARILSL